MNDFLHLFLPPVVEDDLNCGCCKSLMFVVRDDPQGSWFKEGLKVGVWYDNGNLIGRLCARLRVCNKGLAPMVISCGLTVGSPLKIYIFSKF